MKVTGDWLTNEATQAVFRILEEAGFQALIVGGCVRNALMGQPVSDIDIATDARPEKVTKLSENAGLRVIPTGVEHGTVTVMSDGIPHEVTTFRKDVETDGRRAVVVFSDKIEDDALRRDFTINAIYARADGTVVDPLVGLPDLRARRLRFIEDAETRIREDYLRILRFFRFYSWYGDLAEGPDPDGLAACAALADGIETLSKERIGAEMRKLLLAPDPAPAVAAMRSAGVLAYALPGADDQFLAPLVHLEGTAAPRVIRRLAILGGVDVADQLRLSKAEAKEIDLLKQNSFSTQGAAELSYRHGEETGRDIVLLRAALAGQEVDPTEWEKLAQGANASFPISAKDLMPFHAGAALGQKLSELEARWIASDFTLSREELLH